MISLPSEDIGCLYVSLLRCYLVAKLSQFLVVVGYIYLGPAFSTCTTNFHGPFCPSLGRSPHTTASGYYYASCSLPKGQMTRRTSGQLFSYLSLIEFIEWLASFKNSRLYYMARLHYLPWTLSDWIFDENI